MNALATVRTLATRWTVVVPVVAALALVFSWGRELPAFAVAVVAL
ncbi:ionic transporter y4hA, partial [Streptomyces sp. NPDC056004]